MCIASIATLARISVFFADFAEPSTSACPAAPSAATSPHLLTPLFLNASRRKLLLNGFVSLSRRIQPAVEATNVIRSNGPTTSDLLWFGQVVFTSTMLNMSSVLKAGSFLYCTTLTNERGPHMCATIRIQNYSSPRLAEKLIFSIRDATRLPNPARSVSAASRALSHLTPQWRQKGYGASLSTSGELWVW
jgi:hypothetical protein